MNGFAVSIRRFPPSKESGHAAAEIAGARDAGDGALAVIAAELSADTSGGMRRRRIFTDAFEALSEASRWFCDQPQGRIVLSDGPDSIELRASVDGPSDGDARLEYHHDATPEFAAADLIVDCASGPLDLSAVRSGTRIVSAPFIQGLAIATDAVLRGTLPEGAVAPSVAQAQPCHWFRFGGQEPRYAVLRIADGLALRVLAPTAYREPPPRRPPSPLCVLAAPNADQLMQCMAAAEAELALANDSGGHAIWRRRPADRGLSCRLAIVARDRADLAAKLARTRTKIAARGITGLTQPFGIYYRDAGDGPVRPPGRTAMLFSGQGSQHAGMFRELILHARPLRGWFERLDRHFGAGGLKPCRFLIFGGASDALSADDRRDLHAIEGGGAATLTAALGVAELLASCGIHPDVMAGHSHGENAALIASGAIRFASIDQLFERIGQISRAGRRGAAAGAIPLGKTLSVTALDGDAARRIVSTLGNGVFIATDNSPTNFTLFGPEERIADASEKLSDAGALCLPLPLDRAYHTPAFAPELPSVHRVLESLEIGPPAIPVLSCATADYFSGSPAEMRDLAANQYVGTVRFGECIERLYADGVRSIHRCRAVGPALRLRASDTAQPPPHGTGHRPAAGIGDRPAFPRPRSALRRRTRRRLAGAGPRAGGRPLAAAHPSRQARGVCLTISCERNAASAYASTPKSVR